MIRLFVGIALPQTLRDRLAVLAGGLPGARWTPPQNFHITLRFVGEVDEAQADLLHAELSLLRAPACDIGLRGCGAFESGHRAHTLWVGVDRSAALELLHGRIEAAARQAGLTPEPRSYTPHITLARLSRQTPAGRVTSFIAGHNLLRESFTADKVTLFSSHLGKGEPVYRVEAEYSLD